MSSKIYFFGFIQKILHSILYNNYWNKIFNIRDLKKFIKTAIDDALEKK